MDDCKALSCLSTSDKALSFVAAEYSACAYLPEFLYNELCRNVRPQAMLKFGNFMKKLARIIIQTLRRIYVIVDIEKDRQLQSDLYYPPYLGVLNFGLTNRG